MMSLQQIKPKYLLWVVRWTSLAFAVITIILFVLRMSKL